MNRSSWPLVKEFCNHGCWAVVLVRCVESGHLVAYCRDCQAAWRTPEALDRGDFTLGFEECPQGVEIPARDEVMGSSWADSVVGFMDESDFVSAAGMNEELARSRSIPRAARSQRDPQVSGRMSWIDRVFSRVFMTLYGGRVYRALRAAPSRIAYDKATDES